MNQVDKFLSRLRPKERDVVDILMIRIQKGDFLGLNVKRLVGKENLFRVRKGSLRIFFEKTGSGCEITGMEFRNDTTYNS